jgi:hypothetical protein
VLTDAEIGESLGTIAAFEGNQNLRTTDSPTFAGATLGTVTGFLGSGVLNIAASGTSRGLHIQASDSGLGFFVNQSGATRSGSNNTGFQIDCGVNTSNAFVCRNSAAAVTMTISQSGTITSSGITGRNGLTPVPVDLFGTYTSDTSFEKLRIGYSSADGGFLISQEIGDAGGTAQPIKIGHRNAAGTFAARLTIGTDGVARFAASIYVPDGQAIGSEGNSGVVLRGGPSANHRINFFGNYFGPTQWDNNIDLGRSSYRFRDLHLGRNAIIDGNLTASGTINGRASTTAAGTAPLKIATGVLMTTPEAGAIEYDGTNLYITDSGGTRRQLAFV